MILDEFNCSPNNTPVNGQIPLSLGNGDDDQNLGNLNLRGIQAQSGTSRNYNICNLATRWFSLLPLPYSSGGHDIVFGINLAFDPSKSPYYSVICVQSCEVSISHYQIEIYSSGTGDWRLSGKPFRAPFDMVFYDGVFWNGAVHWISLSGASLYFGIDEGRIDTMPPPPPGPGGWGKRRIRHFGESGGHLHIIEIYGPRTTQFVVYEMERDYSNWGVRFCVDLDKVIAAFPEITQNYLDAHDLYYYAYNVLCLIRGGGNEEDFSLLLQIRGTSVVGMPNLSKSFFNCNCTICKVPSISISFADFAKLNCNNLKLEPTQKQKIQQLSGF
ncbi:F-box protein [Vitis vinifera]|uniref:F-box protein n=1 Tax=Vitis vinifera TaxID=29760 RepID=A0A438CJD3_VITVI|nr:F-box protein [Vitis vinifera]